MKPKIRARFFWVVTMVVIANFDLAADPQEVFNVMSYGAVGDGVTLDTKAIQKAIDAANVVGNGAQVLIPGDHQYVIGTLELKSNIDFHIDNGAQLVVSVRKEDFSGDAALIADGAVNLSVSGTGRINGRALDFMSHYEEENEWWIPKDWRPKLFAFTSCNDLHICDITIEKAPLWTLHLLGCENVLVDGIRIDNNLDVPNCDGIDPDHCRNVEIRNCRISCGDDAIVVKAARQDQDYGPSANIWVHDCIIETQDSGVKIGTETTQDIFNITFERCEIKTSCRGLTIQLRDEGNVFNVLFKDINFVSRYHSDPWWGRGEAISFTAIPRLPGGRIGTIRNVVVRNVTGRAENSVRINGTKESRIRNIWFEGVHLKMDRWTRYPGKLMDNRPTKAYDEIEYRNTPGYYIRFADQLTLKNCSVDWGTNVPEYFTHLLEAHDVTSLNLEGITGSAAHPERDSAIVVKED
ncbi:glycoside hydrolase family 28 protein [Mangrovibacterium lignilyticum]|uniref:glycoside hydrolase family 28 protein n=1 Tax=Mangrovibacterium lignilyticum TaxID=2668052 RepID=UPI00196868A7|nr:glycosyl hydrolase family 28 protein [Mangrovibacterium lignilyticum]